MAKRRHKKRTHVAASEVDSNVPKSMVMKMGNPHRKPTKALSALVRDFRALMQPYTAAKLKERRNNKLKDFLVMAGPLGVSHFFIFSQSESGNTSLRIARTPRGPTLYFRVTEYSLASDIQKSQSRPHALHKELRTPPLLIMNNFSAEKTSDMEALLTSTFHNMFPPIDVATTKLSNVNRALLVSKDPESGEIEMRHYAIVVKATGGSRAVRKINSAQMGKRKLPNLHGAEDVSEWMYDPGVSESEGEDEVVPDESQARKKAVKLVEVGPRLRLKLVKIEDGLCGGKTLYHAIENRTSKEAQALEKKHQEKDALRQQRRREQEENVRRKREEKAQKTSRTKRGIEKAKLKGELAEEDHESDSEDEEQDVSDMNDAELEAELADNESDSGESE